jgi:FixJ family two-component response regulator
MDLMSDQHPGFVVAVVDDDHSVLRSLEYLLESADYTVRVFTSALSLLESGGLAQIDCLISDIDMPGMDGFELVGLLHVARPGLRTILITGYPESLKRVPPLSGIYPGLFTKPFQPAELLAAVNDVLRSAATGR